MMRHFTTYAVLVGLGATLLLGCEPAEDGAPGALRLTITDGTAYSGHPSVGYLKVGNALCTATLVGKRTVLTAAHCIAPGATHTVTLQGVDYPAVSLIPHPSWDDQTLANDIAVIRLQAAPPVSPSVVARKAVSAGLKLTLIGYGTSGETLKDALVKRIAVNFVKEVAATRFSIVGTGSGIGNTCHGDSGGPAFALQDGKEVQVGVTSAGVVPCGTLGYDTRVDAYQSWLEQSAGGDLASPTASADAEKPTVLITEPANGARVSASLAVSATVTDNLAVTAVDLLIDGKTSGSGGAPPFKFLVSLTPGAHTVAVVGRDAAGNQGLAQVSVEVEGSPVVTPGEPPGGAFASACSSHAECTSGICATDVASGLSFCTAECSTASGSCPGGAECLSAGARSVCALPASASLTGILEGGCAIAGQPGGDPTLPILLLGLLVFARLRRRR
jgi:MYXO-CTERM domain-containing protein